MNDHERTKRAVDALLDSGFTFNDAVAVLTGDDPTPTTWRGWLKRFKFTRHDIVNAFKSPKKAAKAWVVGVLGLGVSWLAGKGIILPDAWVDDQAAVIGHLVDALVLAAAAWAVPND